MPFLIWFAYANPRDLAEPYLCPIIFALFVALYPPFVSSLMFGWFVTTPLVLGLLGYITGIMRVVIHMADHGYSSTTTGLFAVGTYAAVALFLSQGRVSANARLVYAAVISVNYPYDNVLMPLYHTLVRGIVISADGNMIAYIRSLLAGLEALPLPDLIKGLISQIVHPACDKLFTSVEVNGQTQATFVPNQQCEIPVVSLLDDMGGLFAGSGATQFRVTTDTQYVNFNYRPQFGFLHQLWTAKGSLGMFRGLLLGSSLAVSVLTVMYLMNPGARSRYAAKQGLINVQRKLYIYKARLFELSKLIDRSDIVRERIDLVTFPPTRVSKLAAGSEPSWDVDQLHQRTIDLEMFVQSTLLEAAVTQAPGVISYSHIKALQSCLAEEAAQVAVLARYWWNLTTYGSDANNGTWHHDVGSQIMGVHVGDVLDVVSELDSITVSWMRDVFWTHMSLNRAIERLLTLDEIMGRNKVIAEIVAEVRHQLQLDLQRLVQLDRSFVCTIVQRLPDNHGMLIEEYRKTLLFHSISKAKVAINFCEGELKRTYRSFIIALLIPTVGGLLLIPAALCKQWVSTLVSIFTFKRKPLKYPESFLQGATVAGKTSPHVVDGDRADTVTGLVSQERRYDQESGQKKTGVCEAGGFKWSSRERVIRLWQNAEAWGGLRHFLGQMIILCVYIFEWDLAKWWWLQSGHDHKTQKSTLGDALSLPDVPSLFPHTNNGAGQEDNIKIIDYLVWMDVPTVKFSKQSTWTMLGFYCSLLVSYQGTLKRGCLRFMAMLIGTFSAWCALMAFPNSIWGVGVWACVHMFIPTLLFSNPLDPRLGYDPHWGYAGQILTYHFLVVCFGVFFDPMQSRDELVIERIMGHVWGTLIAFILSLVLFPTSVNTQQRIRLSNSTVGLRRSLRALTELYAGAQPTASAADNRGSTADKEDTTNAGYKKWDSTFHKQIGLFDFEMIHWNKMIEDGSMCDNLPILQNNRVLKQIASALRQVGLLRMAGYRHLSYIISSDELPALDKDQTFLEWTKGKRRTFLFTNLQAKNGRDSDDGRSTDEEMDEDRLLRPNTPEMLEVTGIHGRPMSDSSSSELDIDDFGVGTFQPSSAHEHNAVPRPNHGDSHHDRRDHGHDGMAVLRQITPPQPLSPRQNSPRSVSPRQLSPRQVAAQPVLGGPSAGPPQSLVASQRSSSSSSVWLEQAPHHPGSAVRSSVIPCHSPKRYMSTLSNREIMVVKKVIPMGPQAPIKSQVCPHCHQNVPVSRAPTDHRLLNEGAHHDQLQEVLLQDTTSVLSCHSVLSLIDQFEEIWIGIEIGISNVKKLKVDEWKRELNRRVDGLSTAIAEHLRTHTSDRQAGVERLHILLRMWAVEIIIIKRIASYVEEFQAPKKS